MAPSFDLPITTTDTPAPFGSYNPNQAPGFYLTLNELFAFSLGMKWQTLAAMVVTMAMYLPEDGRTLPDLLVNYWIPDAEAEAENYCGRSLKPTTETRFYDGNGKNSIMIGPTPIYEIIKLNIYAIPSVLFVSAQNVRFVQSLGELTDATQYQDADMLCDPETGELMLTPQVLHGQAFSPLWDYTFLKGMRNIEVTFNHGFKDTTTVPRSFKSAVAMLVTIKALEMIGMQDDGRAGYKTGIVDRMIGREKNMPFSDLIDKRTKDAKRLLSEWREINV